MVRRSLSEVHWMDPMQDRIIRTASLGRAYSSQMIQSSGIDSPIASLMASLLRRISNSPGARSS